MSIFRGFVLSLEVRTDGLAEIVLEAVHAGNTTGTLFIPNLDGDITQSNKRLGQLSLLRDALARVLPVELDYTETTDQGNIVNNVTILPRPSIDGRPGVRWVEGVVIGLGVTELGPLSGSSPYLDAPDLASITLLKDDGSVEGLLLDLQRPDPLTAQDELKILSKAHRTRRPVQVQVSGSSDQTGRRGGVTPAASTGGQDAYIQATRWKVVPQTDLDYLYAFVERLGQRYESYAASAAPALSNVKVGYTTAPGQTPEGDVSDNGTFVPQTSTAWVPDDSPLLARLEAALRDGLQVKLGLQGSQVHEVELVSHLGSAARPIWILEDFRLVCQDDAPGQCTNVPTIQGPASSGFNNLPHAVTWCGNGYFNEGVWRFVVGGVSSCLRIDGHSLCGGETDRSNYQEHAYLKGMHKVELQMKDYTCASTFQLRIYRIR
jgi:hypothetical protein